MKLGVSRLSAVLAAVALSAAAPASAAVQAQVVPYTPWVALSAFASQGSSAALCGTAVASEAAASAQPTATPGCVLPQVDVPPAAAPQAVPPVAGVVPAASVGTLPLLLGLGTLLGLGALLLGQADDEGATIVARPVSP